MNKVYPFSTPQILTDDVFVSYGGSTGTTTPAQRQAAYVMAEDLISEHLGALIVPAIVTGSYNRFVEGQTFALDWTYLQRIYEVRYIDTQERNYFTITGTANIYAAIRSYERSYVDLFWLVTNCQGCNGVVTPYQYDVVYESGLPTGTSTSPRVLMALTKIAQISLNEFIGYGNSTVGGALGIESFKNQEYFEKRTGLVNTVFGSSDVAQYVNKLLSSIRKRQGISF